jgi:hypothetical protein
VASAKNKHQLNLVDEWQWTLLARDNPSFLDPGQFFGFAPLHACR